MNASNLPTFSPGPHSGWNENAAIEWRDATPLGNGRLGALHYGGLAHDRVLLNHEALFAGGYSPEMPHIADELPALRKLLDEGNWEAANHFYTELWRKHSYAPSCARYLPGPIFHWEQASEGLFYDYRRWLNYDTGVGGVSWRNEAGKRSRRIVSSFADDVVFFEPACGAKSSLEGWVSFSPQTVSENTDDDGAPLPLEIIQVNQIGAHSLVARFCGPEEADYTAILVWSEAECLGQDGDRVRLRIGAQSVFVLNLLVDASDKTVAEERTRMEALANGNTGEVFARASEVHRELYQRCTFELEQADSVLSNDELLLRAGRGVVPPALVARMVQFGRYLLITSSAGGTLPPNLQGIWNGNFQPPWWGGFFFNENVQLALMPALPGGLPECMMRLFDLLESKLGNFRENAQKMFGCRGILPPLFMTPDSGLKKNPQAHVQYWTGSGAWLAQLYFETWRYTGDEEFLRNRALPFMREAAAFYEDFFVCGEDGKLHSSPSNSPENAPAGHLDIDGNGLRVCVDATMDFALARELFSHLLTALEVLGEAATAEASNWRSLLHQLPDYAINDEGALCEWLDPRLKDNYHHRHLSHLYPLFPGDEITPDSGPLFEACRIAVEKRMVIGVGSQTGWSLAHMAHVYARLGQGQRALEALELLCRFTVCPSLFTTHNDLHDMGVTMPIRKGLKPAVQTEANQGITSAAYAMLVFADEKRLRLFPALPASWKRGRLSHLCMRGGGRLSLFWDQPGGRWSAHYEGASREIILPAGFILDGSRVDEDGNQHLSGRMEIAVAELAAFCS